MLRLETLLERLRQAILARLNELPPTEAKDLPYVLSIPLDSPTLFSAKLRALVVPGTAGEVRPLIRSPKGQRSWGIEPVVFGGPRLDGVTANTSRIFLGQESVGVDNGIPVAAGNIFGLGAAVDLSTIWLRFVTTDDVLRVMYFTP